MSFKKLMKFPLYIGTEWSAGGCREVVEGFVGGEGFVAVVLLEFQIEGAAVVDGFGEPFSLDCIEVGLFGVDDNFVEEGG